MINYCQNKDCNEFAPGCYSRCPYVKESAEIGSNVNTYTITENDLDTIYLKFFEHSKGNVIDYRKACNIVERVVKNI